MSKQLIAVIVVVVIVIAGGFFLLGGKGKNTGSSVTSPTPIKSPGPHSTVSSITVTGNEFSFSPSTIAAIVDKPLTITFKNDGKYPHNLTIVGLSGTKTIQPGESDTITVTPKKAGSYPFSCTVPGHADKGMTGILMVTSK